MKATRKFCGEHLSVAFSRLRFHMTDALQVPVKAFLRTPSRAFLVLWSLSFNHGQ
jgi:hypothetical protein